MQKYCHRAAVVACSMNNGEERYTVLQATIHISCMVTPAQLMRPGIDRNASCTVGDFTCFFLKGDVVMDCSYMFSFAIQASNKMHM